MLKFPVLVVVLWGFFSFQNRFKITARVNLNGLIQLFTYRWAWTKPCSQTSVSFGELQVHALQLKLILVLNTFLWQMPKLPMSDSPPPPPLPHTSQTRISLWLYYGAFLFWIFLHSSLWPFIKRLSSKLSLNVTWDNSLLMCLPCLNCKR